MPPQVLHLLQELQLRGLLPDVITYSAAINACEKGQNSAAISACEKGQNSAAISACEKGQRPTQALHLLQELQLRGLLPDVITYNAAISACETGQQPQQARICCSSCGPEASCPR